MSVSQDNHPLASRRAQASASRSHPPALVPQRQGLGGLPPARGWNPNEPPSASRRIRKASRPVTPDVRSRRVDEGFVIGAILDGSTRECDFRQVIHCHNLLPKMAVTRKDHFTYKVS